MKKLLIAALMLIASVSFGQTTVTVNFQTPKYYDGGKSVGVYFSDVDSIKVYYTNFIDVSSIDNSSISVISDFVTSGGTSDSLKLIIQGRMNITGTTYMYRNIDTLLIIGATATSPLGTAATTHQLATLTAYFPEVRLIIAQTTAGASSEANANNGTLFVSFYTRDNDYVPPRNKYFW